MNQWWAYSSMTTTTGTTRKKNERKTPTLLRRFTRDTTTEAVDKESMQDTDTKKTRVPTRRHIQDTCDYGFVLLVNTRWVLHYSCCGSATPGVCVASTCSNRNFGTIQSAAKATTVSIVGEVGRKKPNTQPPNHPTAYRAIGPSIYNTKTLASTRTHSQLEQERNKKGTATASPPAQR